MLLTPMIFQQAATDAAGGGGSLISTLMLPVAMIAIFYFLLIRPQQKRQKQHRDMLGALKKGDMVATSGGILGKIVKLSDDEVTLDTGEGGKLRLLRSSVIDVRNPGPPPPANDSKESA